MASAGCDGSHPAPVAVVLDGLLQPRQRGSISECGSVCGFILFICLFPEEMGRATGRWEASALGSVLVQGTTAWWLSRQALES